MRVLHIFWAFPHSSVSKESAWNAGDLGSTPGSGRSPGGGNGNPFQYSCLENPMDRGDWRAIAHGVIRVLATKPPLPHILGTGHLSKMWFAKTFPPSVHFHLLSRVLVEEKFAKFRTSNLSTFPFLFQKAWVWYWIRQILWRKKWQPTPVFLPGKSHGQMNLAGYNPWGCKESYTTEHACTALLLYVLMSGIRILYQTYLYPNKYLV